MERTLGDLAAQLEGLESLIDMTSLLCAPNKNIEGYIGAGTPSEATLESAFYGITALVGWIRREVVEWEMKYMALEKKVEELECAAQLNAAGEARGGIK